MILKCLVCTLRAAAAVIILWMLWLFLAYRTMTVLQAYTIGLHKLIAVGAASIVSRRGRRKPQHWALGRQEE